MRFERMGEGPALVLIPGLACDRRMWAGVAERLAGRFTLVYPETWNQGSLKEAARETVSVLSELGLQRAGVAGLSMGGYVTFELLRGWPERFAAAAILDSTAFADTPERVEKRLQVLRLLEQGHFEKVLGTFAASVLSPPNASSGPVHDRLLDMARTLGPTVYAADARAILERGSYEDVLHTVRVPVLFAAGEHDTLTPPDVARQMAARVPGARAEVIPGAGHMSPLENPERIAEVLAGFFGSVFAAVS